MKVKRIHDIKLDDCKYPNIIEAMQIKNIGFEEIATIMQVKSVEIAKNILIKGRRKFNVDQAFHISIFLELPVEYIVGTKFNKTNTENGVAPKKKWKI